jgi:hypothetical protein
MQRCRALREIGKMSTQPRQISGANWRFTSTLRRTPYGASPAWKKQEAKTLAQSSKRLA